MRSQCDRRTFLKCGLAGGSLLGVGNLGFLAGIAPVRAEDAALSPEKVRLDPSIEPLVKLLEETPRERLLEEVGARIRKGLPYRDVLAALLLAGVRNVQPRPAVGFKFHAVLVVNSAHLASLASPDEHRWLPIFWALDYFKSSQARDVEEGDWTMAPVEESRVPSAHGAREAFVEAMENWDEAAADAAVAGFARTAGTSDVFEAFFRLGARDYRSIGHKAIFVANAYRTLSCIGWQHAEPVLRSLAYALLQHEEGNPAERDAEADRPYRRNRELVSEICVHCAGGGRKDPAATQELYGALRDGSDADASSKAVELLRKGVAPGSLWDAIFQTSSELVLRQPGIISLHAATTSNAIHFAYQTTGNPETRALLLLQAASFIPLFRASSRARAGEPDDINLPQLAPLPLAAERDAIGDVLSTLSSAPREAARKALSHLAADDPLERVSRARDLIDAARMLIFFKGNDAHDYKYSSAVLEDYFNVSPPLRDRFLSASLVLLTGAGAPDNGLVKRSRAALSV